MNIAIMQPTYLPWLGYFDLIDQVDTFVILDTVKLEKSSWQVRNRINSPNGEVMLTIPIKRIKSSMKTLIYEAIIDNQRNWMSKHLKAINISYHKSKYFDEIYILLKDLLENSSNKLSDLTISIIECICNNLKINTKIIKSSNLNNINGNKDELIVSICNELKANIYISPIGASYIEKEIPGGAIVKNNIELYYQNYVHPIYNSNFSYTPYMSVVDLICNYGFDNSLEIIRDGRREPYSYEKFRNEVLRLR